ncbi:THAP domain-containing protein 6-like isoform X2 [Melanotaenia boesemani]|uniref:THAP domain-containing protein 6-like isoform X2 n=1 Tax=Melanotaenia boesemani TaxID=1250792 RepID=UPI001C056BE6|nr:THAP domain-containing protein 6-like isoform X2 [Melanotaenia boesemani]
MPEYCAAYSCSNLRTVENRARGITFHNEHFKPGDFDRTGQIVRLRDGVIPSIFLFPVHLQKLEKLRTTNTSRRADENMSVAFQDEPTTDTSQPQPQPDEDHSYALPASPTALKRRLEETQARVESLARDKKNAVAREKRANRAVKSLLENLREKNLINEELKERLEFYSGKTQLAL